MVSPHSRDQVFLVVGASVNPRAGIVSHETATTSGARTEEPPLYVVLGPHKTAMSFAQNRGIDPHRGILSEGQALEKLNGQDRQIILVHTGHQPAAGWAEREQIRMYVEMVNHRFGRPTDEVVYR